MKFQTIGIFQEEPWVEMCDMPACLVDYTGDYPVMVLETESHGHEHIIENHKVAKSLTTVNHSYIYITRGNIVELLGL